MIKVPTYDILMKLPNKPEENELAMVTEEQKLYKYTEAEGWRLQDSQGEFKISLYEMNKNIIMQLPTFSENDINAAKILIKEFVGNKKYFLHLCRDINYYTLYVQNSGNANLADELINCLKDLGDIKSIEKTEYTNALEIWHVDPTSEEAYVSYFFNYDEGVIECR